MTLAIVCHQNCCDKNIHGLLIFKKGVGCLFARNKNVTQDQKKMGRGVGILCVLNLHYRHKERRSAHTLLTQMRVEMFPRHLSSRGAL